ncbi:hypothetical protein A2U01_0054401, partial [Trifolium medium]|nr:hypothetical protein [Trifolium medium]
AELGAAATELGSIQMHIHAFVAASCAGRRSG